MGAGRPVDDSPVLFVFVGDDASWCACETVGGREVSVAARGIAPAELVLRAVPPGRVRGDVP